MSAQNGDSASYRPGTLFDAVENIAGKFELEDTSKPYPEEEQGPLGPACALRPFVPAPLDPVSVVGRPIHAWTPSSGTVGMSGAGFVGFDLGGDWLMVAIWGAAQWIRLDGEVLFDLLYSLDGDFYRPRLDIASVFANDRIVALSVERRRVMASLGTERELLIADEPALPPYPLTGAPRRFEPSDDLRRAVFLAPSPELWAS